jgi:serine/threonine protein kinase
MPQSGIGDGFRALDTRLGRTMLVKVLAAEIANDEEQRARFVDAATRALPLIHQAVAAVGDVGEHDGRPFIAIEFVQGETLALRMAGQPLHLRLALDYAAEIADAIAEAESLDLTHGDLAASNVMVTAKGRVKVLEFGLREWTRSGRAHRPTRDHYALGMLIAEMTTGRPLTPLSSPGGGTPAALDRVPRDVQQVVSRLMAGSFESAALAAATLRELGQNLRR